MSRVLLLGDFFVDSYRVCESVRLCPEAPVPVLKVISRRSSRGGGGLVADNLVSLGIEVIERFGSNGKKKRYVVGNHLVCRVDEDSMWVKPPVDITQDLALCEAVVISDYIKGGVTQSLAEQVISSGKPVFVDTKRKDLNWYTGAFAVFPNQEEWQMIENQAHLVDHTIVKLGALGCLLDGKSIKADPRKFVDGSGAGDVFLAGFVYGYLHGMSLEQCCQFANHAAGLSVEHSGTYTLKLEDINQPVLTGNCV